MNQVLSVSIMLFNWILGEEEELIRLVSNWHWPCTGKLLMSDGS